MQILAGITDIRYHEQLSGTALTMYGFFWFTISVSKLVSEGTSFRLDTILFAPMTMVYAVFSAVMVYLTAYRNFTLSFLHAIITLTFVATSFARLNLITETLPGIGHVAIGFLAFYYAVASLIHAFTGETLIPLGPPLLQRRAEPPARPFKIADLHTPSV